MTATNMCSNFGGKWDSPPVFHLGMEHKTQNDLQNVLYIQNAYTDKWLLLFLSFALEHK